MMFRLPPDEVYVVPRAQDPERNVHLQATDETLSARKGKADGVQLGSIVTI
jgi:hypothetical protein